MSNGTTFVPSAPPGVSPQRAGQPGIRRQEFTQEGDAGARGEPGREFPPQGDAGRIGRVQIPLIIPIVAIGALFWWQMAKSN